MRRPLLLYSGIATDADLAGAPHMRPAVRLQVEPFDLHRADDRDRRREQADLRADELRTLVGLLARQEVDANRTIRRHLLVHTRLDLAHELPREPFELEVHPPAKRLHARVR